LGGRVARDGQAHKVTAKDSASLHTRDAEASPVRADAGMARLLRLPQPVVAPDTHGLGTRPGEPVSDGPLTPWAFLLFLLAVGGLAGLVLWRVLEATLLRLHGA
jgi:hypothetical protein